MSFLRSMSYSPLLLVRAFDHRSRLGLSVAPPFGLGVPQYPCRRHGPLRPLLTSALRSGGLAASSVARATQDRSPGVSSTAFRAQSPDLRSASLMDVDFAVRCPLVRRSRLISGFCPSPCTFAPRFLQTSFAGERPRCSDSPCVLLPFTSIRLGEDFHLQAVEHAQHTTKPLCGGRYRVVGPSIVARVRFGSQVGYSDPSQEADAGGTPASQLFSEH